MKSKKNFDSQIKQLVEKHGKYDFFEQAIKKHKVTRQIIKRAKFKLSCETTLFSSIGLAVILYGLTGYIKSESIELTFLIPFGVIAFLSAHNHARKAKEALSELSRLAEGIHAKKLIHDY